jgi:HemY protein
MIRWLVFIIVAGLAAIAAGWISTTPGAVNLEWLGYRIETSAAVLVLALLVLVAVLHILYRLLATVLGAPGGFLRARRRGRERRGYEALSRGLVAVAAGDPAGAARQARRAATLLDNRPLTMLLSAQAAQLEGDDRAAGRFFTAMREEPSTRFLALRGLLTQAMKREQWDEALGLAQEAYRLNPDSTWVVETLYALQKRKGRWADAEGTLERSLKRKLLPAADAARERAEVLLRLSETSGGADAVATAARAFKADPGFTSAAVRYARLLIGEDRHSRAASVVERAWENHPAAELADLYWQARRCDDAFKKVQAAQKLAARKPGHVESALAVAAAALEARLWGEARKALAPLASDDAPPRVCRLMAELEEGEHGDQAAARMWLMRASGAGPAAAAMATAVPAAAENAASAEVPTAAPADTAPADTTPAVEPAAAR